MHVTRLHHLQDLSPASCPSMPHHPLRNPSGITLEGVSTQPRGGISLALSQETPRPVLSSPLSSGFHTCKPLEEGKGSDRSQPRARGPALLPSSPQGALESHPTSLPQLPSTCFEEVRNDASPEGSAASTLDLLFLGDQCGQICRAGQPQGVGAKLQGTHNPVARRLTVGAPMRRKSLGTKPKASPRTKAHAVTSCSF